MKWSLIFFSANVTRWELRTKPFVRTLGFLWQEGHHIIETFVGAVRTYTKRIWWMTGRHYSPQAGTSHNLGQKYSCAFETQVLPDASTNQSLIYTGLSEAVEHKLTKIYACSLLMKVDRGNMCGKLHGLSVNCTDTGEALKLEIFMHCTKICRRRCFLALALIPRLLLGVL